MSRNTIRAALRSSVPPAYGVPRPSKLEPVREEIHRLLREDPRLPGQRVRELIEPLGYTGGKTILDDYLRELRPLFCPPPRVFQRTVYRAGEVCQFDLWEPYGLIPVGHGERRRGWVVVACLGYSLMFMLVSCRYERASMIVTSHKPFWGWGRDLRRRRRRRRLIDRSSTTPRSSRSKATATATSPAPPETSEQNSEASPTRPRRLRRLAHTGGRFSTGATWSNFGPALTLPLRGGGIAGIDALARKPTGGLEPPTPSLRVKCSTS
jgi:hypothetical protein